MQIVQAEVAGRDPEKQKRRVCIIDGSRTLWKLVLAGLSGFTFVLDLYHVLEYLWKAAYVFHPEGSAEAKAFVRHRLRMLLEGKVGRVIGGLRQMQTKHQLTNSKAKTLQTVINYYHGHRKWMCYNEYLAAGLPIGSGVVEGACAHVVKDRMEGSGMRWKLPGAEAILKLRALDLNGHWDEFWQFHMAQERQRLYEARKWWPANAQEAERAAA